MVVFEEPIPCYYQGNRTFGTKLYSDLPGNNADQELSALVTDIGLHRYMITKEKESDKKYLFVMGRKIEAARMAGAHEMPGTYIDRIRGQKNG